MFKKKFLACFVFFGALQAAQTLRLKKLGESEFQEYTINSPKDAWDALKPAFGYASPGYAAHGTFVFYSQDDRPLVYDDVKMSLADQGGTPHVVKVAALYKEKGYPAKPSLNLTFASNANPDKYLFKNKDVENSIWLDGSWVNILDLKFEQFNPNQTKQESAKPEEKSYVSGELIPWLEKSFQFSKSSEKISGGLSAPVKIVQDGKTFVWDEKSNQMVKSDELNHKQIFQFHWKVNDDKTAVQVEIWTGDLEQKVTSGELGPKQESLHLNFDGQDKNVILMLSAIEKSQLKSKIKDLEKYRTGINNATKVLQNHFKNKVSQRKKLNNEISDIQKKIKANNSGKQKDAKSANKKLQGFVKDKVELRKKLNEELKPLGPEISANGKIIKSSTMVINYLKSF